MDYHIIKISRNKKQYLDLLLLGDEQETMIDRYLERGDLFVLEDNGIKAVGVVTKEGPEICELKINESSGYSLIEDHTSTDYFLYFPVLYLVLFSKCHSSQSADQTAYFTCIHEANFTRTGYSGRCILRRN